MNEIKTERLKELGFKRYYKESVYRLKLGKNILGEQMYLTLCNFDHSWTWFINSYEQFYGLKTEKRLMGIIYGVCEMPNKYQVTGLTEMPYNPNIQSISLDTDFGIK